MILPFNIRENKGSFVMTLPKPIGLHLEIDKKLSENKSVKLISETMENGIIIRYPTKEEIERFNL